MSDNISLNDVFKFFMDREDKDITRLAKMTRIEPYAYQVWVYSCVSLIANNLAALPRYIYNRRTEEKIESHPLLDLFNRSNKETFGETFFESLIINMLLDGQVFVLPGNKEILGRGQIPKEIYVIKDKYLEAKKSSKNIITQWHYNPGAGAPIPYNTDEIIRCRFFNPYDPKKGLAPMKAALATIYQDASAAAYTANFFKNGAQLGGVLSTDQPLQEHQAKDIAEGFNEKYGGEDKAGKTAVLHSGLKYQSISSTFKDMQYKDQQEFVKERILAAFKVPRSLVADYSDVNYSNSITAKKTFWQEGLLPIDNLINEAFTYQWVGGADSDWVLKSDLSTVEALQEIQSDKIDAFDKLIKSGIPREEAARLLNIPVDWDYVDELEAKKQQALPPSVDETPVEEEEEEEDTDKSIDVEHYAKTIKASMNRYYTKLRNKCLDKCDAGSEIDYDPEEEYKSLTEELKGAYVSVVANLVAEYDAYDVELNDLIKVLNENAQEKKDELTTILNKSKEISEDKRALHELYSSMYKKNSDIAHSDIEALREFIADNHLQEKEQ